MLVPDSRSGRLGRVRARRFVIAVPTLLKLGKNAALQSATRPLCAFKKRASDESLLEICYSLTRSLITLMTKLFFVLVLSIAAFTIPAQAGLVGDSVTVNYDYAGGRHRPFPRRYLHHRRRRYNVQSWRGLVAGCCIEFDGSNHFR